MPVIETLAAEFEGVRFTLVHVDRGGEVLAQFDASVLPTYVLFRDGEEIDRLLVVPGFVESRLRRMLAGAMAP